MISIDPGVRDNWVALWDGATLACVDRVEAGPGAGGNLLRWLVAHSSNRFTLAIEIPQIYQARGPKTDQNDLIDLAIVAGQCMVMFQKVHRYYPRDWGGQTPKQIKNARVRKVLSASENAVIDSCGVPAGKLHNILDAVGIGLHHLGRKYTGG